MTDSPQRFQQAPPPETIEASFFHACRLDELGRTEEAKSAYLELLAQDPTHFGALNNLGNLLFATGFTSAARTAYRQAVAEHPDNPKGHVNLANLLAASHEPALAMQHFEAALRLDPDHIEANRGLAYLLTEARDEERAAPYRQKAFRNQPVLVLPYRGKDTPITLLLLASAHGGMVPMRHHLDETVFLVSVLFVEFYDFATPLPPHQLVFNAIGDADLCRPALEIAARIAAITKAPVINHPSRVLLTGRAENAARLVTVEDVIAPNIALLSRELLESPDAPSLLAGLGLTFPLLLRAPGYHTGRFFVRVEKAEALATHLAAMPGQEFLGIQYIDARSGDGKARKYRVMIVDGILYPLHVAISQEWKVHYFTADMAENTEHRAEDAAFLNNMPQVLGPRAMGALEKIRETLGLDYGGIDFGLSADGEVILFEANATMVVYPPGTDPRWDYRRPATQRILDAIHRLLTKHSLLPLEELLTSGGDARILPDTEGLNKYGCSPVPQPGILSYSSSTASIISPAGFAASAALYRRLQEASRIEAASVTYAREMDRIRRKLITLCDLESLTKLEIILGASGTDLHLFAAQLLNEADSSLLVIMPEASETGSGVKSALEGRHFSRRTALGNAAVQGAAIAGAGAIEVANVDSRFADGTLRPGDQVDAEVQALVTKTIAAGRQVLLMLTDLSKTGLVTPSPACALSLQRRFPGKVHILVDACQFRLTSATLRSYLEQDFLLAMTGSKFITGPAFCGALLVPRKIASRLRVRPLPAGLSAYSTCADWPEGWAARRALGDNANYGLLLRFEAALAELKAFHALPEKRVYGFLETFARAVQKRLANDPVFVPLSSREINRRPLAGNTTWDDVPTIFPFLLRHPSSGAWFNRDETTWLYQLMRQDLSAHADIPAMVKHVAQRRSMLGQPVACGIQDGIAVSALRLNVDARLVVGALSEGGAGSDSVIAEALSVLEKAALIAMYFFD